MSISINEIDEIEYIFLPQGMIYIHANIGPHGNLKSSNCVVDSRLVLKVSLSLFL